MFNTLTQGFKDALLKIKGQARLDEQNIDLALETVKKSLLNADVDFKVTKDFLTNVKQKLLDSIVKLTAKSGQKVKPSDYFIKACYDELLQLLGNNTSEITKNTKGPTVVLLVGLQGAGKTTQAAKIAKLLAQNMRPLLVAADVYRPAAREQLQILGEKIGIPVFTADTKDAVEIAKNSLHYAREHSLDLVIIDTAGRLAIDNSLMEEIENIQQAVQAQNILLVIDSMIGQDAVRTAQAFDLRVNLTGVVLTKIDGDSRGGVALSLKKVLGKNIIFAGTGEGLDKLEAFRPEGMASRILGMGDVVGLMHDFEKVIDEEKAQKDSERLAKGQFDFNDFLSMISTIGKMGPVKDIIAKTPLAGQISADEMNKVTDADIIRKGAIVQSMTIAERKNPELLYIQKSSSARQRIARIAKGSAHSEKDVKDLLEQFTQMKAMSQMMSGFGDISKGGILSKIPGLGQLKQMANMAKMAKNMQGNANMGDLASMFGMPNASQDSGQKIDLAAINRLKKQKKEEKLRKMKKK